MLGPDDGMMTVNAIAETSVGWMVTVEFVGPDDVEVDALEERLTEHGYHKVSVSAGCVSAPVHVTGWGWGLAATRACVKLGQILGDEWSVEAVHVHTEPRGEPESTTV
jgi:hypothetical protein